MLVVERNTKNDTPAKRASMLIVVGVIQHERAVRRPCRRLFAIASCRNRRSASADSTSFGRATKLITSGAMRPHRPFGVEEIRLGRIELRLPLFIMNSSAVVTPRNGISTSIGVSDELDWRRIHRARSARTLRAPLPSESPDRDDARHPISGGIFNASNAFNSLSAASMTIRAFSISSLTGDSTRDRCGLDPSDKNHFGPGEIRDMPRRRRSRWPSPAW